MTKKIKKERKFKREYIPVVLLSILLIILLVALFVVFRWEKKNYKVNLPVENKPFDEIIVDTSNSTCDAAIISKLYETANKISFDYTPKKVVVDKTEAENGVMVDVYGWVFDITFKNIPKDMYLVIENNSTLEDDKPSVRIEYKDTKDGTYTYSDRSIISMVNYTVTVYTNNKNCSDEIFRKFKFTMPIYNRFYDMDICDGYPEFKWCKQFITEDKPSMDEFYVELNKWAKENNIKITDRLHHETQAGYEINCEEHGMHEKEKEACRAYKATLTTTKKGLGSFNNKDDKKEEEPTIKVGDKEIKTSYIYLGVAGVLLVVAVTASVTIYMKKRKK